MRDLQRAVVLLNAFLKSVLLCTKPYAYVGF